MDNDSIQNTINNTFKHLEKQELKSFNFYTKYKHEIFIDQTQAIALFSLGFDPRFLYPDNNT